VIATLFPDGVVTAVASGAPCEAPLRPDEAALVARAAPRRRREFAAGRACAREALARLGIEDAALPADSDRVPVWPPGVTGSISHCADACAVVVARLGVIRGLGLDVEQSGRVDEKLLAHIATPAEAKQIRRLVADDPSGRTDWRTLLFSAKESTYKCYFPLARTVLGFHDVEIVFHAGEHSFRARLVRGEVPGADGAREFAGRLATDGVHVYTGVALTSD
jgi:4'-phosphopantetheinyl transferase EntD